MSMMYIRILVDLHLKYYTDAHDVDEDTSHVNLRGGSYTAWGIPPASGVFAYEYQYISNPGNPDVASRLIYLS